MLEYPIKNVCKEEWNKKVSSTAMYSIPAEDQALPVLYQLENILYRLVTQPIEQTLQEQMVEYFFQQVFPPVCQKIIKSRYFKSDVVLKLANKVLQNSLYLYALYNDKVQKFSGLSDILMTVFSSDEYYFKTNNQLDYRLYIQSYFPKVQKQFVQFLKEGDLIDVIKSNHKYDKLTWSRGIVQYIHQSMLSIKYLNDVQNLKTNVQKDSHNIAPYKSKSSDFDWRMNLKQGDVVDCQQSFGGWYHGTIQEIVQLAQDKKMAKITFKVYDQKGNKSDQKGKYYGFSNQVEEIDLTSPRIQRQYSTCKYRNFESAKSSFQIDDSNDQIFTQINGQKVYAFPRKKSLSEFLFHAINSFGKLGGFKKTIQKLKDKINFDMLCTFIKGISGISQYLHKGLVIQLLQKLKPIIQMHIFNGGQIVTKQFTKQRSEMLFNGIKAIQKRVCSSQQVHQYENKIKMKLVSQCLQSDNLKRKLQGLNELKDIARSVVHTSQRSKQIKNWVKQQNIFQKVYLINSHVQLIKKSEEFFKFLINQSILQVTDLERLYKIAQKGDYQSRLSLYKLFQQVSHIFKKPHVDFLIDTILQSDMHLILNQDIDMLHQLSRYSNYFPRQKVKKFFQKLILGQNKVKELNDYAIKKYAEIVSRGYQMKAYRREIIKTFLSKISTQDIQKVIKVLKGIFQGIGIGQGGKKDLNQILAQQNVDQLALNSIKLNKDKAQWNKIVTQILNFQLFIAKLSYRVKIRIKNIKLIWSQLKNSEQKKLQFYNWANKIMQCEQGIQDDNEEKLQFEQFYRELFPKQKIRNLTSQEFNLAKNLFIQINKKSRYITVTNVIREKQIEKQYKRKVQMKKLRLSQVLTELVFQIQDKAISTEALSFFVSIYNSKQNSPQQIRQFLDTLLTSLDLIYEQKDISRIYKTLFLIQMVINDSEMKQEFKIKSMVKNRKSSLVKLFLINDVSYVSDCIRKTQIYFKQNGSLFDLRTRLAKQYKISWQEVKIIGKYELTDYYNSYTLSELDLNYSDPITVGRKSVSYQADGQLILDQKLNPKVVRIFQIIFKKYSKNGYLSKEDYNSFTADCLGTHSKNYYDKIQPIFKSYDSDEDGLLTFQDFLKFYASACYQRPGTVWSNLKNLGVKGNFKFNNQPDEQLKQQEFPRYILYKNTKFYQILFNLLEEQSISKQAFKLLLRLPAFQQVQKSIRSVWQKNPIPQSQSQNQEFQSSMSSLQIALSSQSKYKLYYKLILISNIIDSNDQPQQYWGVNFTIKKGYQSLCKVLNSFISTKKVGKFTLTQLQIIEIIVHIIKNYIYNGFGTQKSIQSTNLLQYDITLQSKMQFLFSGKFSKQDQKLPQKDYALIYRYQWHQHSKHHLTKIFMDLMVKLWTDLPSQNKNKDQYRQLISKCLQILCILQTGQDQTQFISHYRSLFQNFIDAQLLKQLYCLILCLSCYSQQFQHQHISQLFKFITLKNITSEHFRVLALLVSKFGFKKQTASEIPQILLTNILQQANQPTIQGCAQLLCNFDIEQLKVINKDSIQKIWQRCLFGENITCIQDNTRNQLYKLLLKLSEIDQQIATIIIEKTKNTIKQNLPLMKIVYSNEVNQRSHYGYAGLKNLGNICYMNSMIQQLFSNKTFRYLLHRINDQKQPQLVFDQKGNEVDDNLLHQIQRIFGYLQYTTRQQFVPNAFCIAYKPFGESVNIMIQQDVQQFSSMFFDRLQECIKNHPLRRLIQNIYTGKSTNLFKCHQCNQTKKVEQNFHSVSLQVKNSKTLSESFNRYAMGELINDYNCDFCHKKVDVTKMTRVSKSPQVLIIHLQRIVFNLDTFINQKISTKHQFPMSFNLFPYTLDYYEKQQKRQQVTENHANFQYELTGIIVHIGNAESGHYISFIKVQNERWLQFNDNLVSLFSVSNIQSECFGGYSSTFDDQFDWQKKQNSKSAYLLIYGKIGDPNIQVIIKNLQSKKQELQALSLEEVQIVNFSQTLPLKQSQQPTQSQQDSSSMVQDSQKERQKKYEQQMKQIEFIKKQKSQDNIKIDFKAEISQQPPQSISQLIVYVRNDIRPSIGESLQKQIQIDNRVHFFERSLASNGFSNFFAKLISMPHLHSQQMIKFCQKLTFGFWLKSQSFKQLLRALQIYIQTCPQGLRDIITQNTTIISLMIQNSDSDIRTNVATFLANSIDQFVRSKKITLDRQNPTNDDQVILKFLDKLFDLIPTTVTKCWTKFSQFFQFWYMLALKNKIFTGYMIKKQVVKHFLDYFLDKSSPLKIYVYKKVQQIGSSYASPNFTMLLRCVSVLLNEYFESDSPYLLNEEDYSVLLHYQFLEKLIKESYQMIAAKMARQICPGNLKASERFAVVLLKGFSKSTYQNIQHYIQVLQDYVTIEDEYQQTRMKWVLGKQTLYVSTYSKQLSAINSFSLDERLYLFEPSLQIQQGASFLEPIYLLNKRVQNFCILCVQGVIKICLQSKIARDYIFNLGPPSLCYSRYMDFYEQFIDRYIQESKKSYYSSSTYFDKTQLGTSIKGLYDKLMQIRRQQQSIIFKKQLHEIQEQEILSQKQKIKAQNQEKQYEVNQVQVVIQSKPKESQEQNQTPYIESDLARQCLLKKYQQSLDEYKEVLQGSKGFKESCQQLKGSQDAPDTFSFDHLIDIRLSSQSQQNQIEFKNPSDMSFNQNSNKKNSDDVNELHNKKSDDLVQWQQVRAQNDADVQQNIEMLIEQENAKQTAGYISSDQKRQIDSNQNNAGHQNSRQQDEEFAPNDYNKYYDDFGTDNNDKLFQNQGIDQINNSNKKVYFDKQDKSSSWQVESIDENDKDLPQTTTLYTLYPPEAAPQKAKKNRGTKGRRKALGTHNSSKQSSSEEDRPLLDKQKQKKQSDSVLRQIKTYHPIQFKYMPIKQLQLKKDLKGVDIIQHQSEVVFVMTKPTGTGNNSIPGSYGAGKILRRLSDQSWKSQHIKICKGYFIDNHTRMYIRVQTDDGCKLIKPNESGWIWQAKIIRIWSAQRCVDWPKWSMFQ